MKNKAFTVVELLIAAGISLIILSIVFFIYIGAEKSFKFGQATLNTEANLRLAMDWLTRDIRAAKSISPDTVTLTIPPDTVTLTIPAETGDTTVSYSFDSGKLIRSKGGSRPIAPVSVSINHPTSSTVTIVLHPPESSTPVLSSMVTMRNAR